MPDPITEPPVVDPPKAPEAPTMFDAEGGFTENWTHSLADTSLHDNPTLKTAKTVESLATMTVNAQKLVGMDKERMLVAPNEASSEEEWSAFHKAGGRPETAADYNFARPEELPEEHYSQELATVAQELMHKLGLSKKQADALFAFNNDTAIAQLKTQSQDDEMAKTAGDDKLHLDWGNSYDQRIHMGKMALRDACVGESEEFIALAKAELETNHKFKRLLANLGAKFIESGSPETAIIPTTGDIQAQIDEAMAHKAHGADYKAHSFTKAQHDAQVQKVKQLYESMYPKKR